MSIYNFKSLSSSNFISGFLLLQNKPPNPWHLRLVEGLKYTNKCQRIKMTNIWKFPELFFSLPTAERPGFLLLSVFFSFFFWEASFQCPGHNCCLGLGYNLGARRRVGLSFSVCLDYYMVAGDCPELRHSWFLWIKMGEMMKNLIKKREGMVPERRWLEVGKEIFRVVSVGRDQSGCGLGGRWMGRNGILRSIHQSKKLSYFKISFGGWTMFSLSAIMLEKLFNTPDFIS